MENACDRLVSVAASATPPVIGPGKVSTLAAIPKYAETGEKPCPTSYKWSPPPLLGRLSSSLGKSVTFTAYGKRGKQDMRVEATDEFSSKVAGVIVTVDGGVKCLVEKTPSPDDEDKAICIYSCPFHPVPPITVPATVSCPDIYDDQ